MIIRRRHTGNFAVIPNAVANDRRLALDEIGALYWLLSRPHDWEVSRASCAKIWNIGRDKATRIFRSLVTTGWAQRHEIRAQDGTILGVQYWITDQCGATVDAAALESDLREGDEPEAPETSQVKPSEVTGVASLPQPAFPATGEPSPGYPLPEKASTVLNTESSLRTDFTKYPQTPASGGADTSPPFGESLPTFEQFIERYAPEPWMSRLQAERRWVRLSDADKRSAYERLPAYLADCERHGRRKKDAKNYLADRIFDGFGGEVAARQTYIAKPYSAQWHRWHERKKTLGEDATFMELQAKRDIGWATPTEWPPALPKGLPAMGASGPSTASPLMTADDEEAFINERGRG